MTLSLTEIGHRVSGEIDRFEIPVRHPESLGAPLPPEWFNQRLTAMREGLVTPYWVEVEGYDRTTGLSIPHKVVIVARDGDGAYLAYDPYPGEPEFAMVGNENGQLRLYNIRGNAVDCFMSF